MMMRNWFNIVSVVGLALAMAGCAPPAPHLALGPDGRPLPVIYRIDPAQQARIEFRVLDRVNALRASAGVRPLAFSPQLTAAAATHARDMAAQDSPTHHGTDGSLPTDRARRAGYRGTALGEVVAETYEPELATIATWMGRADTRDVIIDPQARDLGVAFHQDPSGKIWWTLVVGDGQTRGADDGPAR